MSNQSIEGFELKEKVAQLSAAMLDQHPRIPVLLREIHTALLAQPENVTLMTEDEICVIVSGLMKQTGAAYTASMLKGPGNKSAAAKIKSLGADAF